ncbi:hypothetical protein N180_01215 [Pedobacter antarcticus 4BY]|uniref:GmrSD restriction endonucleases N-terminal domain-containing protein n=2 Tax=Pedobacter antarcticus TaxID=34086 RepID=A0A081PC59_9SPHI|nr:DUF262 domain-containing protein [Pedobacter antarcticus]KEQ28282.1 hypothetical protein N180_01215 [Pedobacter antarcticus 4BY]SFE47642.1 Protein of unknown function DUF262 [Pedobacter antarcticus]
MSANVEKVANLEVEEQIKETEKDYNYRLVEWPIEVLTKKFIKKTAGQEYRTLINAESSNSIIIVPEYQREFVWNEGMKAKFIESIFMKVPMPPLFAFTLDDEGNMELIDGVQRLSTIKEFVDGVLVLNNLEVLDTLNGYRFSELEISRQRKFNALSLKIYMLDEETDEGVRADIFNRINSTGQKLTSAEIRKGSYLNNKFYDFILYCVTLDEFTSLFSSARNDDKLRGEKEELITRFFAYSERYNEFDHSVKGFLDDYIKDKNDDFSDVEKQQKEDELKRALQFVSEYFPSGFKRTPSSKSIPKVRFESISVGVNLALKENPNLTNPDLRWLTSAEYKNLVTSGSSNNKSKLVARIEFVKNCLLSSININELDYGDSGRV